MKFTRAVAGTVSVALAALLVAACSSDSSPVDETTVRDKTNLSCSDQVPCPDGLTCSGAFGCARLDCSESGLGENAGCPDGFFCVDPALEADPNDATFNPAAGRKFCARVCTNPDADTCAEGIGKDLECDIPDQAAGTGLCVKD